MKKIYLLAMLCCLAASAQAPQKMSYQAVIRNASGNLVASTAVGMRITLLQGSVGGAAVYQETQAPVSNANGLIAIEIGGGNTVSGNFAEIDWANGPYFIRTETDPAGGINYTITGTSQLLSVPYALYSEKSGQQGKASIYLTGNISDQQAAAVIASQYGTNTENIIVQNTSQLTTLDLSAVRELVSLKVMQNVQLTTLNVPNLERIERSMDIMGNNALSSLSFPSLTYVFNMEIFGNGISSISFASLATLGFEFFRIYYNPNLTTILLPSLVNTNYVGELIFENNALTTSNVNSLLHQFLSVASSGNYYRLGLQTPPAPPTGQGIIDKQTLIDQGNTVLTD